MGLFIAGVWCTLIVGLWIWQMEIGNIGGIAGSTILMLITFFFLGCYIESKIHEKSN
jgi:hypothetical protein